MLVTDVGDGLCNNYHVGDRFFTIKWSPTSQVANITVANKLGRSGSLQVFLWNDKVEHVTGQRLHGSRFQIIGIGISF